jgi:hypothetical protein
MKNLSSIHLNVEWKKSERIIFRVLFIYFLIQAIPLDWKYFRQLSNIKWSQVHYADLFYISRYTPQFFSSKQNDGWGLNTLMDWAVILMVSLIGAVTWSYFDKRRKEYNDLYYLLRVILRYRLAIAVIADALIKVFPLQLPYPSLSLENTNYGDLTDWKIAHLAYGIAPSFEIFLGAVELFAAILLLNKKSASIGAVIITGFVGNVFLSNLGYNGGEAVYALYLLSMAAVLVFYDIQRWHKIIMLGQPSQPNTYRPSFFTGWKKGGRMILKSAFIFIIIPLYSFYSFSLYRDNGYQYPSGEGLRDVAGLYNVREFKINGTVLPYSLTDSVRWQNVVFESWPTISIRSNKSVKPDIINTQEIRRPGEVRSFESSGSSGRQFFSYTIDSVKEILYLRNKNNNYCDDKLSLHYTRPNEKQIILSGVNETGDSIYVVLDKLKKIYLLDESYKIPKKRSVFD